MIDDPPRGVDMGGISSPSQHACIYMYIYILMHNNHVCTQVAWQTSNKLFRLAGASETMSQLGQMMRATKIQKDCVCGLPQSKMILSVLRHPW